MSDENELRLNDGSVPSTNAARVQLVNAIGKMADKLLGQGKRVVPCKQKKPIFKGWQNETVPISIDDIRNCLIDDEYDGIGVVQGKASGGEFTLDFESQEAWEQFCTILKTKDISLPSNVCVIKTGKGRHLPFICPGLTKDLRPTFAREMGEDGKYKVLIELLGEKCFAVRPPSKHYPSGNLYETVKGDICNLPILPIDEAKQLIEIAKSIDKTGMWTEKASQPIDNIVGDEWEVIGDDSSFEHTAADVVSAFNSSNNIDSLLSSAGYKSHGGNKWSHPYGNGIDANTISNGSHVTLMGGNDKNLLSHFGTHGGGGKPFDCFDFWATMKNFSTRHEAIREASKSMGMDSRKCSGIAKGKASKSKASGVAEATDADAEPTATEAKYSRTDLGNAEFFCDTYGDKCRYVKAWKSWLVWDGKRWKRDDTQAVNRLAYKLVRYAMLDYAKRIKNSERRAKYLTHINNSQSNQKIKAMLDLASAMLPISASPSDFDINPWLFNVENGTIDLKTGDLRNHQQSDMMTRMSGVKFDKAATAPTWDTFINRIFSDEDGKPRIDLIEFMKRAVGYSMTGDVNI